MTRWHTPDWKAVKRAAKRAEDDMAVQGWLLVFFSGVALLAQLWWL